MIIETWIAIMIIVFVFVTAFISLLGWMASDQKIKNERRCNRELAEENARLSVENAQMKAKISFLKLHIEMESKK